jgi:hypothetical protein
MAELNFSPYAIAWVVLLVVVIVLAVVRGKMAAAEDDTLKLSDGEVSAISMQETVAKKLSTVETAVASGLFPAALYGWSLFNSNDMFAK